MEIVQYQGHQCKRLVQAHHQFTNLKNLYDNALFNE